ncbi:MAG: DUF3048 domain-containing protein [Oscillospiraceae bacterium]
MCRHDQQCLRAAQVGISNADISTIPAEGGITRMMAIFSHLYDVESVGSIRSRPYYRKVAPRSAIVIHAGGSESGLQRCQDLQR